MNSKMQTKPILKLLDKETFKSNGNILKPIGLNVRALKKGKENGIIIETPFADEKEAIKYAKSYLNKMRTKRIYNFFFEITN